MKVGKRERWLLDRYKAKTGASIDTISRGASGREFDLHISGQKGNGVRYSLWLPLAAIREWVNWTMPEVAAMTDCEVMAIEGNWAGVRDTEESKIWAIFEKYVAVSAKALKRQQEAEADYLM